MLRVRNDAVMSWPFLYFAGDRLSASELVAARLDGDLVDIGEAFMPADAVETRELRAASLGHVLGTHLAAIRATAAWIHGAVPDPPARLEVQRVSPTRIHHLFGARTAYRDQRLPPEHTVTVSGAAVASPERTLTDLVRDAHTGDARAAAVAEALIAWRPALVADTLTWLSHAPPLHFKRAVVAALRARGQEEVTRYTS